MSGEVHDPASAAGDDGQMLPRAINMRQGSIWIAAVLGAAGLIFLWQAAPLDFGTIAMPGPGFIPLILSLLIVALAAIIGVREWRQADSGETVELGHRDVLIVLAAMLFVPALFEPLGAYVTLGLFGAALLVFVARTSVVIAAVAVVVGMVACWYFFQIALGMQLPTGHFWDWGWFAQVNGQG
jgi:hypothetical protein